MEARKGRRGGGEGSSVLVPGQACYAQILTGPSGHSCRCFCPPASLPPSSCLGSRWRKLSFTHLGFSHLSVGGSRIIVTEFQVVLSPQEAFNPNLGCTKCSGSGSYWRCYYLSRLDFCPQTITGAKELNIPKMLKPTSS